MQTSPHKGPLPTSLVASPAIGDSVRNMLLVSLDTHCFQLHTQGSAQTVGSFSVWPADEAACSRLLQSERLMHLKSQQLGSTRHSSDTSGVQTMNWGANSKRRITTLMTKCNLTRPPNSQSTHNLCCFADKNKGWLSECNCSRHTMSHLFNCAWLFVLPWKNVELNSNAKKIMTYTTSWPKSSIGTRLDHCRFHKGHYLSPLINSVI